MDGHDIARLLDDGCPNVKDSSIEALTRLRNDLLAGQDTEAQIQVRILAAALAERLACARLCREIAVKHLTQNHRYEVARECERAILARKGRP